jgi:hypothetical protein
MLKVDGTYWHCTNRDCGMTAACDETESGLETRVCDCGGLMKREAHASVFSYLNFLREETCSETTDIIEKEEMPCEN